MSLLLLFSYFYFAINYSRSYPFDHGKPTFVESAKRAWSSLPASV